jgi:CelD/BcsL family acetyltransferase involved in cellulose biosynthesis
MVSADIPPAQRRVRPAGLRRTAFEAIPRNDWDRLHASAPAATPFSSWSFQRAWWDAYGSTAEAQYLVLAGDAVPAADGASSVSHAAPSPGGIAGIVPLMVRSSVGSPAAGGPSGASRTLFFGASYHADYATALAAAEELPALAGLLADHLAASLLSGEVDRVDLRRLSERDPFLDLLTGALVTSGAFPGISVRREYEDVCPVVELAEDWHAQLGRLDKKSRHEVRRKLRRAEREGHVDLRYLPLDGAAAEHFIHLHQARWGDAGLFAAGQDGERSRTFLHRLVELEAAAGDAASFHIGLVGVAGRPIYALAGFAARRMCYFYNAGMDPAALDLSPGIVGTAAYLRDRIDRGDRRFDFLRGDEAYKYGWGARDTRLVRLLVERSTAA